jgi:hypothetical protein
LLSSSPLIWKLRAGPSGGNNGVDAPRGARDAIERESGKGGIGAGQTPSIQESRCATSLLAAGIAAITAFLWKPSLIQDLSDFAAKLVALLK